MRQKIIAGLLAVACVGLAVVVFVIRAGQDTTAPEIKVEEADITYTEGEDTTVLMEGVTAKDDKDGDLTDKVFIDQIIDTTNAGEGKAIVKYAVIDSANNVGTARRSINYIRNDGAVETLASVEGEDKKKSEENSDKKSEDGKEESEDKKETEDKKEEELVPNGASPAIRLKEKTRTIKVGEYFDVVSPVENIVDDKDSRDTLYRNIRQDVPYDTNKPGTYVLKYYVVDSNGNESNVEEFTLIVQ
ncbi:immunoglobulin-like domain-containing protein [Roseburia hominis]